MCCCCCVEHVFNYEKSSLPTRSYSVNLLDLSGMERIFKIIRLLFFLWHTSKFFFKHLPQVRFCIDRWTLYDPNVAVPAVFTLYLFMLTSMRVCIRVCVCVWMYAIPVHMTGLFPSPPHPAICHTVARSVAVLVFVGQLCDEDVTLQCKARFSFTA